MNQEFLREIQLDAKMIEEARENGVRCEHLEKRFQEKLNGELTPSNVKSLIYDCPQSRDKNRNNSN